MKKSGNDIIALLFLAAVIAVFAYISIFSK